MAKQININTEKGKRKKKPRENTPATYQIT